MALKSWKEKFMGIINSIGNIFKKEEPKQPKPADEPVMTENSAVKKVVRSNTRLFEQYLIAAMLVSYDFWSGYCRNRINTSISSYKNYNDFTKSIYNEIYDCICTFYETLDDSMEKSSIVVDKGFIIGLLKDKMYKGQISIEDVKFAESSLDDIDKLIESGKSNNYFAIFQFAKSGFAYWLELRRVAQITENNYNSKITADELIHKIKSATSDVVIDDSTFMSFDEAVDYEDVDNGGFRMPIATLPIFTRVLAGGLKKGETGIVASLPSGGKTIMACQIASGLALNGFNVLLISTEQHAVNLVPRCITANTGIPFNLIADGVKHAIKIGKLSQTQIQEIKDFTDLMKNHLYFENWGLKGNRITTSLESTIDLYVKTHGKLDVVIIDWIGGGIEKPPEDKTKKNEYYDYTMKFICRVMKQKHLAGVVMAQVNPKQAEDVNLITINELADCKTLDQDASWAMGISRLENPKKRISNQIQASYKTQQTFNFWKNRLSPPYHYPVIREFGFQRFAEREQANPMMNVPQRVELAEMSSLNVKQ